MKQQQRGSGYCRALCCSCRLSVSSSSEDHSSGHHSSEQQFPTISSLTHAMVQERLEQMIRQGQEEKEKEQVEIRRRKAVRGGEQTKFVVMVAMEKSSYDPKEDFRESMVEMIMGNRIGEPKDLRCLLNYYLSMNDEGYHGIILQVFHDVCANLFLRCKCH